MNSDIHESPTYAEGYPYTFSVDKNFTAQALRQSNPNEQQQAVVILSAAQQQISQKGQTNAEGQSFIYGPTYSVIGDDRELTLLSTETNFNIASYNKDNGTVTIEEPFTEAEQELTQQAQKAMLASLTAQHNSAKVTAPSTQLELG